MLIVVSITKMKFSFICHSFSIDGVKTNTLTLFKLLARDIPLLAGFQPIKGFCSLSTKIFSRVSVIFVRITQCSNRTNLF